MITVAVSLLKMKVVAVLLGPSGIGFIGLYLSLVQTASSIAALGMGTVGTRQIAAAHAEGGDIAVGRIRRALFWGSTVLALVGAAFFWLLSDWIARVIVADESRAYEIRWLALGVALSVGAGSQGALLTGLRRVSDLARINIGAGIIGAGAGALALWHWGTGGLVAMVLIGPAATFLLGHVYVARLGRPAGDAPRLPELSRELRAMVTLGFAFMLSGLVATLGYLVVRMLVQGELGPDALGHFQAAWSIGITYLGFVLGAMGTDYFPRLAAVIHDSVAATRLVNEQTEVALLLCAPVLLAMLGLAPWVIHLLYSADFAPAIEVLRWQLLGDMLKVMSWPLGFVLLAAGAGRTFVLTESAAMGVFVLGAHIGLPLIGVAATGVAFLALYMAYLPLVWWLARRRIGFAWTRAVSTQALMLIAAGISVALAAGWSEFLGGVLGVGLAGVACLWALMRLSDMAELGGRLGRVARARERIKGWTTRR